MTLAALLTCIALGTAALAWGYIGVGLGSIARWLVVFGAIWIMAVWRQWRWFAHLGLGVFFIAAALGLWFLNFPPGWMFAGAVLGLLAWDLTHFRYRQRFAGNESERRLVERGHLSRISILGLLGFALASLAMMFNFTFGFDWIVFLAVVLALSVSQIIRWFRLRGTA